MATAIFVLICISILVMIPAALLNDTEPGTSGVLGLLWIILMAVVATLAGIHAFGG